MQAGSVGACLCAAVPLPLASAPQCLCLARARPLPLVSENLLHLPQQERQRKLLLTLLPLKRLHPAKRPRASSTCLPRKAAEATLVCKLLLNATASQRYTLVDAGGAVVVRRLVQGRSTPSQCMFVVFQTRSSSRRKRGQACAGAMRGCLLLR